MAMEDILYTVSEVSKLIKTNPAYVYDLIKAGLLPVLKLGKYKVRRVTLLDFLEKYEGKDLTDPWEIIDLKTQESDKDISSLELTKSGIAGRVFTVKTILTDYFQGAIGETKLRELIKQGKIPHIRVGSKIMFREDALDTWFKEQGQSSLFSQLNV